jgi:RNA polymerase sigma-54 factor
MALSQSLQLKQLQRLSPQQIQLMKLLQVPSAQIEQRIKEELEENPALEMNVELLDVESDKSVDEYTDDLVNENIEEEEVPVDEFEFSNEDLNEYNFDDDDVADYKTKDDYYPEFDNDKVVPIKAEWSLNEILMDQISMLQLNEQDVKIAEQIIGSLEDDGYLRRSLHSIADDLAFKQSILVDEKQIDVVLKKIQQFDPAGIAARDLQECLLLQLNRKQEEQFEEKRKLAIQVLDKYYDEFIKKHYDKIQKGLHLSDDALKQVLHQIVSLNPKPGAESAFTNNPEQYIVPDFTVQLVNNKPELSLNSRNAPPLIVSDDYKLMLKEYEHSKKQDKAQKEAILFIKQKIDSAKWFIDMIKQRQQTLLLTMNAIMQHQESFFLSGEATMLRPMILKDIAEKTGLDVSTVSRVANSKYVQTDFGTYLLKYFFSESLTTDTGEEVSTKEVKAILKDIIEAEDKQKPFSDDELTEMLQEKGYNIARRTVAKYRELLNLPVARLRKELK